MSMTDPIADFLTRIRNAQMVFHEAVDVPYSRIKHEIAHIMIREGYLSGQTVSEENGHPKLTLMLKYGPDRTPAIRKLRRISKPGRRVYVPRDRIPSVLGGLGINILTTSKGILTGRKARQQGVGGEILVEVY
ncbi:MAG: 30S ribosomal protein S8 [Acidobacteriota bacterium]